MCVKPLSCTQAVVASAALWQQEISISSTNVIPFSAVLIDLSSFHHFKPFCVHFACNSPLSLCTHALKRSCTLTQILQDSTLGPVKVQRPHNCRMPFFLWQHQITPASCPAQRCVHSQRDGLQGTAVMHCPLQTFFFFVVQLFPCSAAASEWRVQSSNANYSTSGWWELTSGDDMDSQEITVDLAGEGKCN